MVQLQIRRKAKILEKREIALQEDKEMPVWNAGMAENAETFNTWLDLTIAKDPQKQLKELIPCNIGSGLKKKCWICGPDSNEHCMKRCPKALAMTRAYCQEICRRLSLCHKCTGHFTYGHKCYIKCRLCVDYPHDMDHCILMCPINKYWTGPVEDPTLNASPGKGFKTIQSRKRSAKASSEELKRPKLSKKSACLKN